MIRGVIFDMDGTITVPYIDWSALRAEIGAEPNRTLIEYIESLDPEQSAWAMGVLEKTENEAALNSELNHGVQELLDTLRTHGIRTALVTNNNRRSMEVVLEKHGLAFDVLLSREDGAIKPSADLIEKAVERLGLPKEELVVIGDGRYDLEASRRAGVSFILLKHPDYPLEHGSTVCSLTEVEHLILQEDLSDAEI